MWTLTVYEWRTAWPLCFAGLGAFAFLFPGGAKPPPAAPLALAFFGAAGLIVLRVLGDGWSGFWTLPRSRSALFFARVAGSTLALLPCAALLLLAHARNLRAMPPAIDLFNAAGLLALVVFLDPLVRVAALSSRSLLRTGVLLAALLGGLLAATLWGTDPIKALALLVVAVPCALAAGWGWTCVYQVADEPALGPMTGRAIDLVRTSTPPSSIDGRKQATRRTRSDVRPSTWRYLLRTYGPDWGMVVGVLVVASANWLMMPQFGRTGILSGIVVGAVPYTVIVGIWVHMSTRAAAPLPRSTVFRAMTVPVAALWALCSILVLGEIVERLTVDPSAASTVESWARFSKEALLEGDADLAQYARALLEVCENRFGVRGGVEEILLGVGGDARIDPSTLAARMHRSAEAQAIITALVGPLFTIVWLGEQFARRVRGRYLRWLRRIARAVAYASYAVFIWIMLQMLIAGVSSRLPGVGFPTPRDITTHLASPEPIPVDPSRAFIVDHFGAIALTLVVLTLAGLVLARRLFEYAELVAAPRPFGSATRR